MKTLSKNFFKCGILGWCLEIIFTALHSLRRRDFTLRGSTSLWMFPIYGAGCLLTPVFYLAKGLSWPVRGILYAGIIYSGEYLSGHFLKKRELCPWDYGRARWNVGRIIRLDYLPCWMITGLCMEYFLTDRQS